VSDFKEIHDELIKLEPDSYITEIAEERVELGTIGEGITPTHAKYSVAIDYLREQMKKKKAEGVAKIAQAFRYEYYDLVKNILLQQTQVIPCFAGILSAQVSPNGDVWPCCIRGDSMGNLRENNYDFKKVWISDQAKRIRKSIKAKECHCPLANASYTNMLASPKTVYKVVKNIRSM
jgi:MoaA/NifB/PqqE/SkfB family radical SAM enzyme